MIIPNSPIRFADTPIIPTITRQIPQYHLIPINNQQRNADTLPLAHIRLFRQALGATQAEMYFMFSSSHNMISNGYRSWESGINAIPADVVHRMQNAMTKHNALLEQEDRRIANLIYSDDNEIATLNNQYAKALIDINDHIQKQPFFQELEQEELFRQPVLMAQRIEEMKANNPVVEKLLAQKTQADYLHLSLLARLRHEQQQRIKPKFKVPLVQYDFDIKNKDDNRWCPYFESYIDYVIQRNVTQLLFTKYFQYVIIVPFDCDSFAVWCERNNYPLAAAQHNTNYHQEWANLFIRSNGF